MSRWRERVRARRGPRSAERALARATKMLIGVEGVASVGLGRGEDGSPRIEVGVDRSVPSVQAELPERIGGVPLVVRETGEMSARDR